MQGWGLRRGRLGSAKKENWFCKSEGGHDCRFESFKGVVENVQPRGYALRVIAQTRHGDWVMISGYASRTDWNDTNRFYREGRTGKGAGDRVIAASGDLPSWCGRTRSRHSSPPYAQHGEALFVTFFGDGIFIGR